MSRQAIAIATLAGGIAIYGFAMSAGSPTPFAQLAGNVTSQSSALDTTLVPSVVTSARSSPATPSASVSSTTTTVEAPTTIAAVALPSTTAVTASAVPVVTHAADIGVLAPRAVVAPTRLIVPALSIDGPVIEVGVNAENELDVPPDARTLAWYRHGPTPGEPGSAVIAGHLDWRGVEGHFAELTKMPVGATITVVYSDDTQLDFTVSHVESALKQEVVVRGVFEPAGEPVLRLVTCGGEFDQELHSYRSNVIITAVLA